MKRYASPGVDSNPGEVGVYNSGAGQDPNRDNWASAGEVTDWSSANPVWSGRTGRLIGNYSETQAPPANSLRIRRRGISPWGGRPTHLTNRYNPDSGDSMLNVGGSVDMNPGCSSTIAGGVGQASSMVRMYGRQRNGRGTKLPTLPPMADRGGITAIPSGGISGMVPAPLIPEMLGLPSIIKVNLPPYKGEDQ